MAIGNQLLLLLWKNFVYRRRNKVPLHYHPPFHLYHLYYFLGVLIQVNKNAKMSFSTDPADHRAALAAFPVSHPHRRTALAPSLQAQPV